MDRFRNRLLIGFFIGCARVCRIMLQVDRKLLWLSVIIVIRRIGWESQFSVILIQNVALLFQISQRLVRLRPINLFTSLASQMNRLVIQLLVVCLVIEVDGSFLSISRVYNSNVLTQVADVICRVKRVIRNRLAIDRWRKARHFWNLNVARLG